MTKAQYIDFIRNSLQMADKTDRYHHEQVAAAINNAVNTVFFEMFNKNPSSMRKAMERYAMDIEETSSQSAMTNRYGNTLDVDIVDLPRKAGGILSIIEDDTTTTKYVPVSILEGDQLHGSESSLPDNVIGFSMNGPRNIEYWNMSAATDLIVRVIPQFRSFSDTDNVPLPYGQDQRIIELVRQYLAGIPPKDTVNNEVDRQQ